MAKADQRTARTAIVIMALLCVAGMILSVYAYHVETSIHGDPTFKALCDISEHMSCSKVFSSRYGTGFGFIGLIVGQDHVINQPNSVYGMIFFVLQAILAFKVSPAVATLQLVFSVMAATGCVYLAYILYFILHDFCIVCVSTYVLNTLILVCSVMKYKATHKTEPGRKQKSDSKKAR